MNINRGEPQSVLLGRQYKYFPTAFSPKVPSSPFPSYSTKNLSQCQELLCLIQHGGHIKSSQRTLKLLSANCNVHSHERGHLLTSENIRLITPVAESASHNLSNEEMLLLSCGSSMPNYNPIIHHELAMILQNPLQMGMTRGWPYTQRYT